MNSLITFYKKIKNRNYFENVYLTKYAFVGMGNHSINNLYPVLNYLNVPLKYIIVKTKERALLIGNKFSNIIASNNFSDVLTDSEVANVFICAKPKSHYELVKTALLHNKNVFVEKPPCTSLQELEDLIETVHETNKICLVGMQKRYSPCSNILKKRLQKEAIISYNYRYVTGNYPEGDEVVDLYMHPLDLISYLFGDYKIISLYNTNSENKQNGSSVFLHLLHNNFIGNIEISTNYMWNICEEQLQINTKTGLYTMENHDVLTYLKKQGTLLTIPLEKVFPKPKQLVYLFNRNNFNPVINNNQLYTSGYYQQLVTFIALCEGKKANALSTLHKLKPTFTLIEAIKKSYV